MTSRVQPVTLRLRPYWPTQISGMTTTPSALNHLLKKDRYRHSPILGMECGFPATCSADFSRRQRTKSRFNAHNEQNNRVPFDLSAQSTKQLLHADALSQVERRGVSHLPSVATAKSTSHPNRNPSALLPCAGVVYSARVPPSY